MLMMLPIVADTSFNKLAIVDDYTSFIWTSRYYETGDFELVVPVDQKHLDLMKKDYYIFRDDDPDNAGIIEDVLIKRDETGTEQMIVSGRFLQSILGRRIVAEQTNVDGTVAECMNTLINDNIMFPSDSSRIIEGFDYEVITVSQSMKAQYTGNNIYDVISDICKTYGVGFKVIPHNNGFLFRVYEGTDRSYAQSVNPWIVFSDEYDNLLSSEYEECYQNQITAVLVAGEGEGLDRKTAWATDGTTGLLRREAYKNERNLRSNDGSITPEEYTELLEESGKQSLTQVTTAFTGTVYFDSVKFREDVFLGDICTIENSRWGLSINTRLVEVIESVSETGDYSIVPTFGI